MLAGASQNFAVFLIIAAAAGYLLVIARRSWQTGHGSACSGCHNLPRRDASTPLGVPGTRSSVDDPNGPAGHAATTVEPPPHRMFLPIENFADTARRHRTDRDRAAEATAPPATTAPISEPETRFITAPAPATGVSEPRAQATGVSEPPPRVIDPSGRAAQTPASTPAPAPEPQEPRP